MCPYLHIIQDATLKLVGVVTYYGKHYSTFFLHGRLKFWIYFDDATVKEIGCWQVSWLAGGEEGRRKDRHGRKAERQAGRQGGRKARGKAVREAHRHADRQEGTQANSRKSVRWSAGPVAPM